MQIDFHHGTTYVVARLAGFNHNEASIIAHSAQYVDDSTNAGAIRFNNGIHFHRISSAHKSFDYRNFRQLANYQVWLPFHFLPGNGGLPPGQSPPGRPIDKLICYPNSYVAQDMVRHCILCRRDPFHLYRLGIVMHVYADTWAHQGFVGINHRINQAKLILDSQGKPDCESTQRVRRYFNKSLLQRLASLFVSEALPLGHGAVLSNPDKPFLKWGYINGLGQRIERDNPKDFLEAAEHMCRWMQRYRAGDPAASVTGLPDNDKATIEWLMRTLTDKSRKNRHHAWLAAIQAGKFSFGEAAVTYIAKGKDSWKYQALGTENEKDTGQEVFFYNTHFLNSHWKLFHDALQAHRRYIVHDLMPRYGIIEMVRNKSRGSLASR